jgi:hypothetical protein
VEGCRACKETTPQSQRKIGTLQTSDLGQASSVYGSASPVDGCYKAGILGNRLGCGFARRAESQVFSSVHKLPTASPPNSSG